MLIGMWRNMLVGMKFVQPLWTVVCQFFKKLKYLHKRIEHICPHRDVIVQLPSHVQFFVTSWTAAHQASLSLTISRSLPKFMSIALVMHPPFYPLMPSSPSALKSFPASGTFPMSQLFASDDQKTGVSASASVLPISIQG